MTPNEHTFQLWPFHQITLIFQSSRGFILRYLLWPLPQRRWYRSLWRTHRPYLPAKGAHWSFRWGPSIHQLRANTSCSWKLLPKGSIGIFRGCWRRVDWKTPSQKYCNQKRLLQYLPKNCESHPKTHLLHQTQSDLQSPWSWGVGVHKAHRSAKEVFHWSQSPSDVRLKGEHLFEGVQVVHALVFEREVSTSLPERRHEGQASLHQIQKRSHPCHPRMMFIF